MFYICSKCRNHYDLSIESLKIKDNVIPCPRIQCTGKLIKVTWLLYPAVQVLLDVGILLETAEGPYFSDWKGNTFTLTSCPKHDDNTANLPKGFKILYGDPENGPVDICGDLTFSSKRDEEEYNLKVLGNAVNLLKWAMELKHRNDGTEKLF